MTEQLCFTANVSTLEVRTWI